MDVVGRRLQGLDLLAFVGLTRVDWRRDKRHLRKFPRSRQGPGKINFFALQSNSRPGIANIEPAPAR
jgi:hypothetical protein